MRKDYRGADLTGADLTNARLFNTIGDGKVIKTLNLPKYTVNIVKSLGVIQIGCEQHTAEEWFGFSDYEIEDMDDDYDYGALEWWHKHRQTIKEEYDNA